MGGRLKRMRAGQSCRSGQTAEGSALHATAAACLALSLRSPSVTPRGLPRGLSLLGYPASRVSLFSADGIGYLAARPAPPVSHLSPFSPCGHAAAARLSRAAVILGSRLRHAFIYKNAIAKRSHLQ